MKLTIALTREDLIKEDRRIRRVKKMIRWMIYGQFQHGISPMEYPELTPERIEELYNVNFGD